MTVKFTIHGPPRTKNTGKLITCSNGRKRIVPPKPYLKWFNAAMVQKPFIVQAFTLAGVARPFRELVEVTATFYRKTNVGDMDRYFVALGDFLQQVGAVENEKLIWWGKCRLEISSFKPRIEVELRALGEE